MFLKYYRIFALTLVFFLTVACTATNNVASHNFIVLDYKNFGPQEIAEELIGPNYWQWDNGHYSQPQNFDIKVVVYRDMALDKVKEMFPIDEQNEKDYRYVQYTVAMDWHDKHIAQFNEDLKNSAGDSDIAFYFLRKLYANALKIERALRK
jgi:hypothetical protein